MKQSTHIGVYALIKKAGSMILIKKARGPYTGNWDLPGGSFEFGETPVEALHREVMEETGLTISEEKLLDVVSHTVAYKNADGEDETVHHIGMLYRVSTESVENLKEDGDGEDSHGAEWIEISSINDIDFSPFASRSTKYIQ